MSARVWRGDLDAAAELARLHAPVFSDAWPEEAFRSLLGHEGVVVLMGSRPAADRAEGFVLIRASGQECEILTFCVAEEARRARLGGALMNAACDLARSMGAVELFLEVGEQNAPAIALYRRHGFVSVGRRSAYYHRGAQASDALVMRKALFPH